MDNSFSKEQLIALHDLGKRAAEELDVETPRYDEEDTSPIEIHKTNDEHTEAMTSIFADLSDGVTEE